MMSMRPSTYEWDGASREGPIRAASQSRNVSFSIPHMPMSPLPSPMPLPIPSPVPDMWNYSTSASAPSSPVPFTMMDQRMAQHQGMTMQQVNMQHQHPITGMPHLSYQEIQIYPHLTYEQQQQQHHEQHHHHSSQQPPHPIPMIYHPSSSTSHPQIQVEYVQDEHKPAPPTRNPPPRINPHTAPVSSSHPSPSSSNASTPKTQTSAPNQNNKRKATSTTTSTTSNTSSSPTPKRVRGRGKELELVDGQMVHLGQRRSRYARLLERMNAELMTCKLTLEQQKQRIQQLEEEKQKELKQNQTDAWRRQHSRLTTAGLYDIMYMSSPFMIVIFDLNLRIMDANQAYLNEHGWTMDEIFGRRVPTVQMQIFAHPKFDTSKHPVNDLDVPPLKAGLPPDISASDLIVTQETFMAFKYVYEGRAPAARIRMAEIDARGRLGLMQVHSYLHYEKGADMLGHDYNNNNNSIDGSSHDGHSVLSSPPASPAHVTSQMPIPYSRPTTPQDAYFLSLMSLKKPSFCPQRGQPMYFVSQCNIYERQILKTTPENDPASHAFAAFHEPASILHHLQQGTLSPTPLMMKSGGSSHCSSRTRSPAPYMSSNVSTPSIASSAETPPSPLTWTADVPHSIQDYEHMYKQQVSEYIQNHPEAVNSRENTALFPVPLPHDDVPQVKHSIPSKYASPFGPPKDDLAWLQSDVTQ